MGAAKKKPRKVAPELRGIGKRSRELREQRGWTTKHLANVLGINESQVTRLEKGERLMQLQTLLRLCEKLGAPVGYVIGGEGEPPVLEFEETDGRKRKTESD